MEGLFWFPLACSCTGYFVAWSSGHLCLTESTVFAVSSDFYVNPTRDDDYISVIYLYHLQNQMLPREKGKFEKQCKRSDFSRRFSFIFFPK